MAYTPSSPFATSGGSTRAPESQAYDPVAHGYYHVGDRVTVTKNTHKGENGVVTRFTPKMMYIKLDKTGTVIIRNCGSLRNPAAEKRAAMDSRPPAPVRSFLENNRLTDILTDLVLHVEFAGLGPRDRLAQEAISRRYEDIITQFEAVKLG